GASIVSVDPVAGSNGTEFTVTVGTGAGDGTITLTFTGTGVRDIFGNPVPGETFQASQAQNGMVGHFRTADVNGDGKVDLISDALISDASGGVAVALGNGDGTFGAPATFPAGTALNGIAVGD